MKTILWSLLLTFAFLFVAPADAPASTQKPLIEEEQRKLLEGGETIVSLQRNDDDIIDISGSIYIHSLPERIWSIISDYDNMAGVLPRVVESRVVSENGNVKVVDQTSKTGVLFVKIKFHTLSEVTETYPERLSFELLDGDFEIFTGTWLLVPAHEKQGTFVSWSARVKPTFSAPEFIMDAVQKRDLRDLLETIRELSESGRGGESPARAQNSAAAS